MFGAVDDLVADGVPTPPEQERPLPAQGRFGVAFFGKAVSLYGKTPYSSCLRRVSTCSAPTSVSSKLRGLSSLKA